MIRLRVLGALDLRDAMGQPIDTVLAQPKRFALLAYLALAVPPGFQRRDVLVALLWPELDQARARNALSQALHHLRRALGADALTTRGDEEIALVESQVWCDARAFAVSDDEGRIEEALTLYTGDLLPGFFVPGAAEFEQWLDTSRQHLKRRAAAAAWKQADASEAHRDGPNAARWSAFAANLSPDDEGAQRRLIALLERIGDRAGALRAFDDFARRLAAEYQVAPSEETLHLVRSLRSGNTPAASSAAPPDAAAPVMHVPPMPVASGSHNDPMPRTGASHARTRRAALFIAIVVVVALGALVTLNRTRTTGADTSIAVLPFLDLGPNHDDAYLSDGMAEELSDALSQVPGLRVTSRTSAFAFKGKPLDARAIGRALNVGALLEGSVRRENNTLRVTAQLIDTKTGYHRWSRTYDRELADVFTVQDDIARAIVGELAIRLAGTGAAAGSLARHATTNLEAYTLYLRGRYLWNQRTGPALTQAIASFERAIALDSTYASAYAGVADAYNVMAGQTYMSPAEAFPRAKAAATRALALDSTLAEAHAALGFVHLFGEWNGPAARRQLETALTLDPNYSSARLYRAFYLAATGKPNDGVAEIRRAQLLDPLSLIISARVGYILVMARRFGEAIGAEERALDLDSTNGPAHWSLGDAYAAERRFSLAATEFAKARAYSGLMLGDEGFAYAASGNAARAKEFLARLDERARREYVDPYDRALVYVGLGDRESAFRWLRTAREQHSSSIIFLRSEPMFDALRGDPRFAELVRQVGL